MHVGDMGCVWVKALQIGKWISLTLSLNLYTCNNASMNHVHQAFYWNRCLFTITLVMDHVRRRIMHDGVSVSPS